jgi:hypothetical protein
MRDDMARVIVERPRIPDFKDRRKGRSRPLEALPAHEGMRRPHLLHGDGKTLNENLRPLRRYLERQVGRPWDKVYAEIAANLRVDNAVQQHVRDHLRDFVAVKARRHTHGWHGVRAGPVVAAALCRPADRPALPHRPAARRKGPPPQAERPAAAGRPDCADR